MELYKKYRPSTLKEIVGNKPTVKSIQRMLDSEKVPQTILLHGPSGCGKTTLARILVTELQCDPLDFVEMNSSTYRGIDSVRELSRVANLCARGSCKVYMLDEAHKMTSDAQNAILKLLEDTPRNTYFILCTTEPDKLIAAIRTRCCELEVSLLPDELCLELITRITGAEGIEISDSVKDSLVDACGGSARKLLVLLDRIQHLTEQEQMSVLMSGVGEESAEVIELCRALAQKKSWREVTALLRKIKEDPEKIRWAVMGYANAILMKKADAHCYNIICSFSKPFYDSKMMGVTASCYEVCCMELA